MGWGPYRGHVPWVSGGLFGEMAPDPPNHSSEVVAKIVHGDKNHHPSGSAERAIAARVAEALRLVEMVAPFVLDRKSIASVSNVGGWRSRIVGVQQKLEFRFRETRRLHCEAQEGLRD